MSFTVVFSQKALDVLDSLPVKNTQQIIKKIEQVGLSPFSHLKKLRGTKLWRLRVGKYRVVLDVLVRNKTLYIVRIGLRKNIYD